MGKNRMVETIEKRLGVKVEKVLRTVQDGREVIIDISVGGADRHKVVLKEMKNQYGVYYRIMSDSKYIAEVQDDTSTHMEKEPAKFRTKTERLCGARRKDIISFAEMTIGSLADGLAMLKEIEGPAKDDTAVRFVLLLKADGTRFKEDIAIKDIRDGIVA